jgi:hypothetical protein
LRIRAKSIIAILLVFALLTLAACSGGNEPGDSVSELVDSVSFDSESESLTFMIPDGLPSAYSFCIEVAGRVKMGDGAMSVHLFEEETETGAWEAGKTYGYEFAQDSLLSLTMLVGAFRKDDPEGARELLHNTEINIDENGNITSSLPGESDSSEPPDPATALSSEATMETPPTANPDLAAVFEQISTEPQALTVGCEKTDNSSGSLALQSKDELLNMISDALTQTAFEQLTFPSQPPYVNYVRVALDEDEIIWELIFLEEYSEGASGAAPATFLSLMKQGYPEPVFFSLDREVFDSIYGVVYENVYMPEPPKEEFVKPLQELVEAYKNGTVVNNDLEPRFGDYPVGEPFPVIETVDDFVVEPGNDMVRYYVIIPIGDGSEWEMVVGISHMFPQAHLPQIAEWTVNTASFRHIGTVLSQIPNPSSAVTIEREYPVDADGAEISYMPTINAFFTKYYNTFVTLDPQDFGGVIESNENTGIMENMLRYYVAKYRADNTWLVDFSFEITVEDVQETEDGFDIQLYCTAKLADKDGNESGERLDYAVKLSEGGENIIVTDIRTTGEGPTFYNHFLNLLGQDYSDIESRTDEIIMAEFIEGVS